MKRTAIGLVFLVGCGRGEATPPVPSASAAAALPPSASAAATGDPPESRLSAITAGEHERRPNDLLAADFQSRDARVRRAAARASARIGGEGVRGNLLRALSDEDGETVAWGAYGLGHFCKGHEKDAVAALVARALSYERQGAASKSGTMDVAATITRAVGRCATEESEATLVAWLGGDHARAVAASLAMGDLASVKQKLREETLAALLNAAAGSAAAPPVPEALFAVGRLEHVPETVVERIREVATARLAEPGPARVFAIKALGRANDDGAVELGRVLATPATFTPAERAEAARALKRHPRLGPRLLGDALPALVPNADPVAATALVGEELGVLLTVLDALEPQEKKRGKKADPASPRGAFGPAAKKALGELAALAPPNAAPASLLRRFAWIRCGAAKVLARANFRDKALVECDVTKEEPAKGDAGAPEPEGTAPDGLPATSIGARAVVEVLGRAPLVGPRLEAWRKYARDGEIRAREAAIGLLEEHDEVEGAAAVLAQALEAKPSGIVGAAAEVLAKQPQRASVEAAKAPAPKKRKRKKTKPEPEEPLPKTVEPSEAVVKPLLAALGNPAASADPELLDGLVDAAGALGLKQAKARLLDLCRSPYPTTREHTAKALGLLGEKLACDAPPEGGAAPDELQHLVRAKTTLSFETDAGSMTILLDPELAPVAVTRMVDLARGGFFDGLLVHRVVPGFVTQFGAPHGDGSGGPEGKPALRCETSPVPFAALEVGVALSGRDTGSSQLFVMHALHPHLDGAYARVGTAAGPWASFVDGDRIRRVTVSP